MNIRNISLILCLTMLSHRTTEACEDWQIISSSSLNDNKPKQLAVNTFYGPTNPYQEKLDMYGRNKLIALTKIDDNDIRRSNSYQFISGLYDAKYDFECEGGFQHAMNDRFLVYKSSGPELYIFDALHNIKKKLCA